MRRFGKTKQLLDEAQRLIDSGEQVEFIWPSSPWPRVVHHYDGSRITRFSDLWDYDECDPWPIPRSLLLTDPLKYAEMHQQRNEYKKRLWDAVKPKLNFHLDEIKGKAIFSTLSDSNKEFDFLWGTQGIDSEPSLLKHFFIPSNYKHEDEI
jgi:hypothetical protein